MTSCPRAWKPRARRRRPARSHLAVAKFPSMAGEKNGEPLTVAVTGFLADLRLSGSERVMGALALALAEGMDASPPYAKGKLARELREVLSVLAQAELSPANLSLLRGIEQ